MTAQEITARSVRFSLPNSVAGTSCSFYAVANTDYGEITTTAAMGALLESTTLDEYNGTFEQTGLGRKRSAGFIMTDRKTSAIAAAGNSSTVSLTLKRTVAKIAVRAKLSDDFGSKYNGGTVVITSAELARAANTCYSFFDPELYRQSARNYSHEQTTRAANGTFDNMFYAYEALGVIPVRQGIYVQLKGYFDSDGSGATSADRSDVTYTIFLEASDNGAIHRNAYYRVEATIRGLSGDGVVVNTIISDWETPITQTVELGNYEPDETGRQWAYERFIYYPYPEGTRLDSVVSSRDNISYFYHQEVPTAEAEGNQLLITLQGRVAALDHSEYRFPLSDTLEYNISSMLNFVDTTTRYVTRVIEKYAVVNDRNYLNFHVNRSDIIDTLADNTAQLARIEGLMDEILNQKEFHVDNITLTASASPEGIVRNNDRLARDRAHSLRERLVRKFSKSGVDTLITVRWVGEDWAELERLVREDGNIKNRAAISEMIAAAGKQDMDDLEDEIERRFPQDYNYLLQSLYPRLRAVDFRYDLRRVGMIKDTIHTTVPDTLYARGVTLLKGRKYREAMKVLDGFNDRNAAICMLSLGFDERAYSVLKALPEHSTHSYLLAIVCVRLWREDEALEHFDRAVELNENIKWRGQLDPEISELIKNRADHVPE